jgi:hypothetical protein
MRILRWFVDPGFAGVVLGLLANLGRVSFENPRAINREEKGTGTDPSRGPLFANGLNVD